LQLAGSWFCSWRATAFCAAGRFCRVASQPDALSSPGSERAEVIQAFIHLGKRAGCAGRAQSWRAELLEQRPAALAAGDEWSCCAGRHRLEVLARP